MNSNEVKAHDGSIIYENDVYVYFDEYIRDVLGVTPEYNLKSLQFNGALKYVCEKLFINQCKTFEYNSNTNIDYRDANSIYNIISIYENLCLKYNKPCSYYGFSKLTGISRDTLNEWKKPDSTKDVELGSSRSDIIKKISVMREDMLQERMIDGGLMDYANLKCNYGWTETPQQFQLIGSDMHKSIEQIAQEHQIKAIESADASVIEQPRADF